MGLRLVITLTFLSLFPGVIFTAKGGEMISEKSITTCDLYSSPSTMLIDRTVSPWGENLLQELFFLLASTQVPENVTITLTETKERPNRTSDIVLLWNNEQIGIVQLSHSAQACSNENVVQLYRQIIRYRNSQTAQESH